MKKITILLFALFAFTQVNAQLWTINSCSTLGSTIYGPMYSLSTANATNRTAVIYPSSQLASIAGQNLNGMYFQRSTATGTMSGSPNFKIYLKEVTANDWGASAIDWTTETTGATLVYDSNPAAIVGSDAGWKSFPLSTNFLYSGTQNLAVFMEYTNATASSSISWFYEYIAPCSNTSNNNTTKYNNNTSGTLAASLASTNFRRPFIGFDFVVSCNAPNSLVATNVGTTTVDMTWVENSIQPQNGYEYYNSTSATTPTTTETPTGTTASGVSNIALTGLSSATTYYFWVRGNCGTTDKSIWIGPVSYTTACLPFLAPFNENFDGLALITPFTALPNCWEVQTGPDFWDVTNDITNAGNTYSPDVGDHTTGSANYMWIDASSDITANEMVTPLIDMSALTAPYVGFWYLSQNTTNSIIHSIALDVWDGTAWLNLVTQSSNLPNWTQVAAAVPSTVPTITKFRIYAIANPNGTSADYFYNDLGVDDFFVIQTPPCPLPNNLTASSVTASSAVLGWTENGSATTWNIEYGLEGFTQGTGSTIVSGVTSNPYTLTSLAPATAYEYYVQSDCGAINGVSTWSGPFSFLTECVEVTTFVENFDTSPTGTGNLPTCWSKLGSSNNVYTTTGANAPMSPSNRLYMNINTTNTAYAVLPAVSNLQANTHRLKLKAYATAALKVLSVGYFATPGDINTYVEIEPLQMPSTNLASTQEFTIIPTGIPAGVNQLVFTLPSGSTTTVYVDDVKWEINSTCVEPTALVATAITNSGATLGWVNGGLETLWDIQYGLTGFAIGTGTIVNGVTTNPYSISGLTANTSYEFYVRGVCTGPENSAWSGPFLFKTQCADVTEFSENFDSYPTGSTNPLPDCWNVGGTSTTTYLLTGATAPMSPNNRLYMFASGSANPPTEGYAILPSVSNLQANTHRLRFKGYATVANRFIEIGYLTDPSDVSTFIQIQEVYLPATNIASTLEFFIQPTGIPAGVKNLAIKNPGFPSSTTAAYIDDVIWEAIPSCPAPTLLVSSNITSDAAQLSWTEMGSTSLWNIEYGPTGFTQGMGTTVSGVGTNPYTLTALTPATTYDYYVQADCGSVDGVSLWSGPNTFTTACVPFTAPYNQNFDGLALVTPFTALPNCWETQTGPDFWDVTNDVINAGNTYSPDVGDHTTGSANYMWIDASSDITANEMVTPLIDISGLTSPYVGFWFLSNNTTNTINHTIALDVWNGTGWLNIVTQSGNFPTWVQVAGTVPSTVPTITKFRIYAIADPTGTSANYFYNDLGVDDFFVIETPACPMPSNLTVSNVLSSSVTLNWTENGSATAWNIEYGPTGFAQGSGTVVSGITSNPYAISGLMPATTYQVYLQSDCGTSSGVSSWAGPISFTTSCVAISTLPWTENFESLTSVGTNSFPPCWIEENGDWATAVASTYNTPNSGTNYLRDSWAATNEHIWTVGFDLVAGTSYDFSTFIQGDGFTGWTVDYLYNTAQSSTGATQLGATYAVPGSGTIALQPYANVTRTFVPTTSGVYYFGIRVNQPSGTPWYVAFDDFELKETPSVSPVCATNIAATPNPCGNFANTITWDASTLANGYFITVGTTPGATDIANNVDVSTNSYSFVGTLSTTYYFTVIPYNGVGSATGCTEQSFTTSATGCYCVSDPSSNDGLGITNVEIGTTNFATGDVTYFDHSTTSVSIAQGENANVQISFATGFTYDSNIWIDFNDNFIFEASEIVYSGESLSANPTILNASFLMPATATLGNHKMRLGTADSGQSPPDPCYNGLYGVTLDFSVTVTASLSSDNFDLANFVAYPNPVKDVFNISYSSEITSVRIINLLGQEVISRKVGANSTQIDMSDLSTGAYIISVSIGDTIKTIKVIKQQ